MILREKFKSLLNNLKYIKQERGAVFVLTAILLPVLFGCLGIGYDVGNIYMHKARLQNIADAAALAGARAYLQSQYDSEGNEKAATDSTKDNLDEDEATDKDTGRPEVVYSFNNNNTIDRSNSLHRAADEAADEYIKKNIVNLGTDVKSDRFSHYALRGRIKNADAATAIPKEIFYRIGLSEEVPLHFLPVILGEKKSKQTVRAGAVALVVPGTTTSEIIPGPSGSTTTITHPSIFDNLFTFSESLITSDNITSGGAISQNFIGDMVYTHQNGLADGDKNNTIYYDSATPGPAGDDDRVSTNFNHWYESKGGNGSTSTSKINDPIIDTSFDTKAYLEAFRSKLQSYHLDVLTNQAKVELKASDINNDSSYLYSQPQKDADGNDLYSFTYGGKSITYAIDTSQDVNSSYRYYSYDENNNNKVYYFLNNFGSRVPAYAGSGSFSDDKYMWYEGNYVLDENGNVIYYQIQNDDVYFANADKKQIAKFNRNSTNCYYTDSNTNNNVAINYIAIDKNSFGKESDKLVLHQASNVIHVPLNYKIGSDTHSHSSCHIIMDESLEGNENVPLYILIDGVSDVEIHGTAETTRRPVIIVFLSKNTTRITYEFKGDEFKGVIYAPISDVEMFNNLTGTFRGNIITKRIYIQANSDMSWVQENYLEHYQYKKDSEGNYILDANGNKQLEYKKDENGNYVLDEKGDKIPVILYMDDDVKAVSDDNKRKIESANAALTEELKQKIRDKLGITEEQQNSMDWFENLRYPEKQNLFTKWKQLFNEYKNDPAIRNILWPWNEHFNIEVGEDQPIITTVGETLRLINFRTEYQINTDGSVPEKTVLNPFIFKTLGLFREVKAY